MIYDNRFFKNFISVFNLYIFYFIPDYRTLVYCQEFYIIPIIFITKEFLKVHVSFGSVTSKL